MVSFDPGDIHATRWGRGTGGQGGVTPSGQSDQTDHHQVLQRPPLAPGQFQSLRGVQCIDDVLCIDILEPLNARGQAWGQLVDCYLCILGETVMIEQWSPSYQAAIGEVKRWLYWGGGGGLLVRGGVHMIPYIRINSLYNEIVAISLGWSLARVVAHRAMYCTSISGT